MSFLFKLKNINKLKKNKTGSNLTLKKKSLTLDKIGQKKVFLPHLNKKKSEIHNYFSLNSTKYNKGNSGDIKMNTIFDINNHVHKSTRNKMFGNANNIGGTFSKPGLYKFTKQLSVKSIKKKFDKNVYINN